MIQSAKRMAARSYRFSACSVRRNVLRDGKKVVFQRNVPLPLRHRGGPPGVRVRWGGRRTTPTTTGNRRLRSVDRLLGRSMTRGPRARRFAFLRVTGSLLPHVISFRAAGRGEILGRGRVLSPLSVPGLRPSSYGMCWGRGALARYSPPPPWGAEVPVEWNGNLAKKHALGPGDPRLAGQAWRGVGAPTTGRSHSAISGPGPQVFGRPKQLTVAWLREI